MIRWILYDDPESRKLRPLTWLRPASGLLIGAETTEARWRRLVGSEPLEVACRSLLVPLATGRIDWVRAASNLQEDGLRPASPDERRPGIQRSNAAGGAGEIWVSDLVLPHRRLVGVLRELDADTPFRVDGRIAGFRSGPRIGALLREEAAGGSLDRLFDRLETRIGPPQDLEAERLSGLADLVRLQAPVLSADLDRILSETTAPDTVGDGSGYRLEDIRIGPGCRIDLGSVLDARNGPIVLGPDCEVTPQTWIQGPFFSAGRSQFLGGRIGGGTSVGPRCRVRGEVEASVLLGYDNKVHDGFLGHSYAGEWVNLGALTTNSDLKNNYSVVNVAGDEGPESSGMTKVGIFLGDHVKTRIGCLLSCGTVVGVGANLFGDAAVVSGRIPDFSWGTGPGATQYEINKFLRTVETVYERRGVPWTPEAESALREVHVAATRRARSRPSRGQRAGGGSDPEIDGLYEAPKGTD